jgi:ADP-L-glycero-D-manno-heptose 6-epimerase
MLVLTGGAGFIGSCFLRKLNDEGIKDILVVDNLGTHEKWKNLLGKKFKYYYNKDEFRQKLKQREFAAGINAIIHFGACSSTTETDAEYLLDNNLAYSIDLAEYADRNHIKFIYASSAATYGDGSLGYSDKNFDGLMPLNCYGFSKQLFDNWVIDSGLDTTFTGIKFFNVFGPNEYHKAGMASMVFKSYKQIKETGKVCLFKSNTSEFADGGQKRDFVYVRDVVEVVWQMFIDNSFSGIYNLGTGKSRSWNDLANAVFASLGIKPDIEYVDMPESIANQYQNYTEADMSKLAESGLKYKFRTLEESVADYVNSYLEKNQKIY